MGWKRARPTWVGCTALFLSCSATVGWTAGCEKKSAPVVAVASGPRVTVDGAGFAGPAGRQRMAPRDPGMQAYFIGPESTEPDHHSRAITVEVLPPPAGGDVMTAARDRAAQWGGRVEEKRDSMDGVEAVRVRVYAAGVPELTSKLLGILTVREGKLYVITGWAPERASIRDEVEALIASWKWDK